MQRVVVTDCGSTTTKALLFEKGEKGWYFRARGEAPTTVEQPVANVTVGVTNAFSELEELSHLPLFDRSSFPPFFAPAKDSSGLDLYLSTSSAGGGLQMMVAGLVAHLTTESAERAALGAGAIVIDSVSADDGRTDHERVEKIRSVRPDIFLLCGGIEGGAIAQVVETAELLLAAAPRPRFGDTLSLPIIFAGNSAAADEVSRILSPLGPVTIVANVRPELEKEDLGPAREAIHEFFLSHVMSHSPGYGTLMSWASRPIMPTPLAVGTMIDTYATKCNEQIVAVDIGGATTDVFSSCIDHKQERILTRTVSANLGMSYSIGNVLLEAGIASIARWLPFVADHKDLRNRLRNKMIRPTTIPQTLDDLFLEQAVCREALRLSFAHHCSLAISVHTADKGREIGRAFEQESGNNLVSLLEIDTVIGSGGVISHAPQRSQAALMMIDGLGVEGVTRLLVDSVFMLPHLGVFSTVEPIGASDILERDCLIHLGYCIAPIFSIRSKQGTELGEIIIDKSAPSHKFRVGDFFVIPLTEGEHLLQINPSAQVNVGNGNGIAVEKQIIGGGCGLIIDCRGRPLRPDPDPTLQADIHRNVMAALGISA
jgi:uncharacterized protein (TIGR01319 family)